MVENQAPNGQQERCVFLDGKSECGKGEGGSGTLKSDQRRSGLWKERILSHLDPFSWALEFVLTQPTSHVFVTDSC